MLFIDVMSPPAVFHKMRIPKQYGASTMAKCPFCGKVSLAKNKQGLPVCVKHKEESLEIKCTCSAILDLKSGKWGPYFNCINCGNITFARAMEIYRISL